MTPEQYRQSAALDEYDERMRIERNALAEKVFIAAIGGMLANPSFPPEITRERLVQMANDIAQAAAGLFFYGDTKA